MAKVSAGPSPEWGSLVLELSIECLGEMVQNGGNDQATGTNWYPLPDGSIVPNAGNGK
jgi:hypothetical protein